MKFQLTVICESAAELAEASARLTATPARIAADDNPRAGFPPDAPNPFASAAVAPSIAPVAPPVTVPTPPVATTTTALPPVPAAAAPAAPVVPTSPANAGAELDSRGMPWDARIHAANRGKVTSGQWRAKKNVEDALVVQVEAELRATMAARAPGGVVVPPVPTAPLTAAQLGIVPPEAAPVAPQAPVAETFQMFMVRVGPLVQDPTNMTKLTEACNECGLPSLGALASRADLLPAVGAMFASKLG